MPKRFLLGGRAKHPEIRNQIAVKLINNTINHHTIDQVREDSRRKKHSWTRTYFRMFGHGYKRFGKSGFLRIKRQLRIKKRQK